MRKSKAIFLSLRPFVLPFSLLFTLYGTLVAGFQLKEWLLSFGIVSSVWFSTHTLNNARDFVRGLDSVENGSKPKAYTSASQLLPKGILTVKDMMLTTAFLIIFSCALLALSPLRIDVITAYILGLLLATTYTDVGKPKALHELYFALGGASQVIFSYAMVRPITPSAIATSLLPTTYFALVASIDRWKDVETDFKHRIRGLTAYFFKAQITLKDYIVGGISLAVSLHLTIVLLQCLPSQTLIALLALPLLYATSVLIDRNIDKGSALYLLSAFTYVSLMCVGLVLS